MNELLSNKTQQVTDAKDLKQQQYAREDLTSSERDLQYGVFNEGANIIEQAQNIDVPEDTSDDALFAPKQDVFQDVANKALIGTSAVLNLFGAAVAAPFDIYAANQKTLADLTVDEYDTYKNIKKKESSVTEATNNLDNSTPETSPESIAKWKDIIDANSPENYSDLEKSITKQRYTTSDNKRKDLYSELIPQSRKGADYTPEAPIPYTKYDAIESYNRQKDRSKSIHDVSNFIGKYIDHSAIENLHEELSENFSTTKKAYTKTGLYDAALIFSKGGIDILATHPAAVVDSIIESAPDTLLAGRSLVLAAALTGERDYVDALADFEKEHKRPPVLKKESSILAVTSFLAGITGAYGDHILGTGGEVFPDFIKKFKPVKVASEAVGEFLSEGTETLFTEYGGKQNLKKIDFNKAYADGMIGFGSGGVLGTISTVNKGDIKTLVQSKVKNDIDKVNNIDISNTEDIDKGLTEVHTRLKDEKTQGPKKEQYTTLFNGLYSATVIGRDLAETALNEAKEELNADPENSEFESKVDTYQEKLDRYNEILSKHVDVIKDNPLDAETYTKLTEKYKLTNLEAIFNKTTDIINKDDYEGFKTEKELKKALASIVSHSINNPSNVDLEVADAIAQNESINPITAATMAVVAQMKRIVDKASIDDVSQQILSGGSTNGRRFFGVLEYQTAIMSALSIGNIPVALAHMESLKKFRDRHKRKLETYERGDLTTRVDRDGNTVTSGNHAPSLIEAIRKESKLLNDTYTTLDNYIKSTLNTIIGSESTTESTESTTESEPTPTPTAESTESTESTPTAEPETNTESTATRSQPSLKYKSKKVPITRNGNKSTTTIYNIFKPTQVFTKKLSDGTTYTFKLLTDTTKDGKTYYITEHYRTNTSGKNIHYSQKKITNLGALNKKIKSLTKNNYKDTTTETNKDLTTESESTSTSTIKDTSSKKVSVEGNLKDDSILKSKVTKSVDSKTKSLVQGELDVGTKPISSEQQQITALPTEKTDSEKTDSEKLIQGELKLDNKTKFTKIKEFLNNLVDGVISKTDPVTAESKYFTTNLVKKYYKAIESELPSLLLRSSDILKLLADPQKLANILKKDLSSSYINATNRTLKFSKILFQSLDSVTKNVADLNYRWKAPFQFLLDKDNNLSTENKNAILFSVLNWLTTQGMSSLFNDERAINNILNKSSKSPILPEAIEVLSEFGTRRNNVVNDLGLIAIKFMGIQSLNNIDQSFENKFIESVGSVIYNAMIRAGILEETSITIGSLIELDGQYSLEEKDAVLFGVKIINNTGFHSFISEIGITSLISDITNADQSKDKALFKVPKKEEYGKMTVSNGDGQKVPKKVVKSVNKLSNTPFTISENFHKVITALPTLLLKQIGGFISDTTNTHPEHLKLIKSLNLTVNLELQQLSQFFKRLRENVADSLYTTNIYFKYNVDINLRQSMSSKELNPQRSKLHRYALNIEASTYNLSNKEHTDRFKLIVAQGLGIKTDKKNPEKSLAEFEELMKDSDFVEAIEQFKNMLQGEEITNPASILAATNKAGEKFASLKALTEYSAYELALEAKKKSFDSSLSYESDGVTHGPIMAAILQGLKASQINTSVSKATKGGFLTDEHDSLQDAFEDGVLDTYETNANNISQSINKSYSNLKQTDTSKLSNKDKFLHNLDLQNYENFIYLMQGLSFKDNLVSVLRSFVKTPITSLNYGAGFNSIFEGMVNSIATDFYKELSSATEIISNNQVENFEEMSKRLNDLFISINSLIKDTRSSPQLYLSLNNLNTEIGRKNALLRLSKLKLSKKQLNTIVKKFSFSVGQDIKQSFNKYFQNELVSGTAITTSIDIIAHVFIQKYNNEVTKLRNSLRESGQLSKYEDLSRKQYKEIKEKLLHLMPIIQTMFSSNNSEGLQLTTKEKVRSRESSRKVESASEKTNGKGIGSFYVSETTYQVPSTLSMPILNIAYSDGQIQVLMGNESQENYLQVYDGVYASGNTIDSVTESLNKATNEVIERRNYLDRVTYKFNEISQQFTSNDLMPKNMSLEFKQLIVTLHNELFPNKTIDLKELTSDHVIDTINAFKKDLQQINKNALEGRQAVLSKVTKINQFVGIGNKGIYSRTASEFKGETSNTDEKVYDSTKVSTDHISKDVVPNATNTTESSNNAVEKITEGSIDESTSQQESSLKDDITKEVPLDPFRNTELESELKEISDETGAINIGEKTNELEKLLFNHNNSIDNKYHALIFKALTPILKGMKDAPILRILSSKTPAFKILVDKLGNSFRGAAISARSNKDIRNALGIPSTDSTDIYINSTDTPFAGMSSETILHEIIHAIEGDMLTDYALYKLGLKPDFKVNSSLNKNKIAISAIRQIYKLRDLIRNDLTFLNELRFNSATAHIYDALRIAFNSDTINNRLTGKNESLVVPREFLAWGLSNLTIIKELSKRQGIKQTKNTTLNSLRRYIDSFIKLSKQILGISSVPNNIYEQLFNNFIIAVSSREISTIDSKYHTKIAPMEATINERVQALNTKEVFNNIPSNITTKHESYLKSILDNIVDNHINEIKRKYDKQKTTAPSEDKLLVNALDPAIPKESILKLTSGFNISNKEAYVHKLLSTILNTGISQFGLNSTRLKKLYIHAKNNLSYKDFIWESTEGMSAVELSELNSIGKLRYENIFINHTKSNKDIRLDYSPRTLKATSSEYLANFITLAMTNENFRKVLDNIKNTPTNRNTNKTFKDTVTDFIKSILKSFSTLMNGSFDLNDKISKNLSNLAKNLSHIELKEKSNIELTQRKLFKEYSKFKNNLINFTKNSFNKLADIGLATKLSPLTIPSHVIKSIVNNEYGNTLVTLIDNLTNHLYNTKAEIIADIWDDIRGTRDSNRDIHRWVYTAKQSIDKARNTRKQEVAKWLRTSFGRILNTTELKALSKIIMQADITSLFDHGYNLQGIVNLISDKDLLDTRILALKDKLNEIDSKSIHYYTKLSKSLGHMMVTGIQLEDGTLQNPALIAMKANDSKGQIDSIRDKVLPLIDELATLHAIDFLDKNTKDSFIQLYNEESARGENNGITFAMSTHAGLIKLAKEKNFKDSELLVWKGYMPEIYNPNKSIKIGSLADKVSLQEQGYTIQSKLYTDPKDPNKATKYLYINEEGGMINYQQGIIALVLNASKGTTIIDKYSDEIVRKDSSKSTQDTVRGLHNSGITENSTKSYLMFSPDINGNISSFRYVMSDHLKNTVLDRDTNFYNVMGTMAGTIEEKHTAKDLNNTFMKVLKKKYNEDVKNNNLQNYVTLSAKSSSFEYRNLWHMLPEEVKLASDTLFGDPKIPIRKDLLKVSFGQRLPSIRNLFIKETRPKWITDNAIEQVSDTFGITIGNFLRKGERGLIELVKFVKDVTIIRSIFVLTNNSISNQGQLFVAGMTPNKMAKYQKEAIVGAKAYINNTKRINLLNHYLYIKYKPENTKKYQAELLELNTDQSNNKVGKYIEEGLLSSVASQLEITNPYSLSSKWIENIEGQIDRLPKALANTLKFALVTKGSKTHSFLSDIIQLSDFAARYALIQHQVAKGINEKTAIENSIDEFINYDLPMNKYLEYASSAGALWYPKFWIRIQKIILKSLTQNLGRTISLMSGSNLLDLDLDTILGSNFLSTPPWQKLGFIPTMIHGLGTHPLVSVL